MANCSHVISLGCLEWKRALGLLAVLAEEEVYEQGVFSELQDCGDGCSLGWSSFWLD